MKLNLLKEVTIKDSVRYCGRNFSLQEMELIAKLVNTDGLTRTDISRDVCQKLNWLKPDGKLKDMSCRVALLRMEKDGFFTLPPPKCRNGNSKQYQNSNLLGDEHPLLNLPAGKIQDITLEIVRTQKQSLIWNEMIHRWHYLGFKKLVGAQLRYIIKCSQGYLGALGFSASAWNIQPREDFIGWNQQAREKNLHLIINNSRFLILPWVKSKNLASKILSLAAKQLPNDWENRYQYRPVLLETFVDKKLFPGTCYKAANWIYLGETKGRGKLGDYSKLYSCVKLIMVYPLFKNFRLKLQLHS